jgi:hypothetical protein
MPPNPPPPTQPPGPNLTLRVCTPHPTPTLHRLGIILEVKLSIVKNLPVRRTKQDIKPEEFVSDIQALSSSYSEAVKSNSQYSLAVWEAMKDWSETQVSQVYVTRLVVTKPQFVLVTKPPPQTVGKFSS